MTRTFERNMDYIEMLNQEHGLAMTGYSPVFGGKYIPKDAVRIIVKDFGNGLGRVIYTDNQNRFIANNMEALAGN